MDSRLTLRSGNRLADEKEKAKRRAALLDWVVQNLRGVHPIPDLGTFTDDVEKTMAEIDRVIVRPEDQEDDSSDSDDMIASSSNARGSSEPRSSMPMDFARGSSPATASTPAEMPTTLSTALVTLEPTPQGSQWILRPLAPQVTAPWAMDGNTYLATPVAPTDMDAGQYAQQGDHALYVRALGVDGMRSQTSISPFTGGQGLGGVQNSSMTGFSSQGSYFGGNGQLGSWHQEDYSGNSNQFSH